ncbi:MAG: PEGA domain-containing protein [Rectinema sp.]|nr:PEGA domain-containing protein [Betaproteobacteria bacterium]
MIIEFAKSARRLTETAGVAAVASLLGVGVVMYAEFFGTYTVVVASTPAGATIRVEEKEVGQTPLRVELKKGTYTIEAKKPGYIDTQHALYVSQNEGNVVNLLLLPDTSQSSRKGKEELVQAPAIVTESRSLDTLNAEIQKVKSIILANPEDAASLPIVQEKVRVQSEEIKALKDDLRDVKELAKWYLGSMIAIIVGLLAVIATLFVSQRGK